VAVSGLILAIYIENKALILLYWPLLGLILNEFDIHQVKRTARITTAELLTPCATVGPSIEYFLLCAK